MRSHVSNAARQRGPMPLRGRSYIAFALTPEPPIMDWLAEIDGWLASSQGFFAGRPVVLDLSAVRLTNSGIAHLISELGRRDIRIMGIEGVAAGDIDTNLPPLVSGGRPAPVETSQARSQPVPPSAEPERAETSLMVHSPVRSGQAIFFPSGDVTIIGSVASGAEVIAGGSIHIYGTLRGRAMAGTSGNRQARIFCSRIAAELLAIDGYYRTAESLEAELRNKPIQAWLEGETLIVAAME